MPDWTRFGQIGPELARLTRLGQIDGSQHPKINNINILAWRLNLTDLWRSDYKEDYLLDRTDYYCR